MVCIFDEGSSVLVHGDVSPQPQYCHAGVVHAMRARPSADSRLQARAARARMSLIFCNRWCNASKLQRGLFMRCLLGEARHTIARTQRQQTRATTDRGDGPGDAPRTGHRSTVWHAGRVCYLGTEDQRGRHRYDAANRQGDQRVRFIRWRFRLSYVVIV
jgi:hypothetical protein